MGYILFVMIFMVWDDISDWVKGLDGGVDEYIGKLFVFEELFVCLCLIICCSLGSVEEFIFVGEFDFLFFK